MDARGPAAGVQVELIPVEAQEWRDSRALTQLSGRDGRYIFQDVSPGRYFLAIHFSSPPNSRDRNASVYPPFFYPDAIDRKGAAVVEVAEGGTVELTDFMLPSPLVAQKVEGAVVWDDGSPVQGGGFVVVDSEFPGWSYVDDGPFDKDGRFSTSLFQGRRYIILARTLTREDGDSLQLFRETMRIEFLVTGKPDPIKLVMPAQSLKNARP
jgi:hypothetical protein